MSVKTSWIDEANTRVHIADVLARNGVIVPEAVKFGSNKKVHCPFGFYHSDGGISKAMRVYGKNNTAYCFSCSKRYSPVTLAAAAWDCSWMAAAMRLLEDSGFKPKSLEERWVQATTQEEKLPDLIALADALKVYCSTVSENWEIVQLNNSVANKLTKCLDLLDSVKTAEGASRWLTVCKKVMLKTLEY